MIDLIASEDASVRPAEFNIVARAGFFIVNFRSPYNSMHQTNGLKTEEDARAWLAEARHLAGTYRP